MSRRPSAKGVEHRITIAASPAAVWQVLADFDQWGTWNPLYVEAAGKPLVGARFTMTIVLSGMKPQRAEATVVTVEPASCLEYAVSNLGGLVKAFRYIDIYPGNGSTCEVANGEIMTGALGVLLGRIVGEKVRVGLQAMNEALKIKLEGQKKPL